MHSPPASVRHWLALALLLSVFSSEAAVRYVSTSGLDTNPGTLAQPWRTIQKAANTVVAGDIVNIRGNGGIYAERVTLTNRDGTAALPIVFQTNSGDPPAILDLTGFTPLVSFSAVFRITSSDYITVQNLEIRNYKSTGTEAAQLQQIPVGLYVVGDCNGVAIRNCKVHDIWQSSSTAGNGFGIAAYGNNPTAINGLVLDGNEVYNLRTGSSESVTLNGNVTNFQVTNNTIHDCNNIGIDCIGFEGTNANAALDQARFGLCAGNTIYNIDSKFNPAYGGNFTTGGDNSTRSAPGMYVDGGRDIVLERNRVFACNFALSLGSETLGRVTSNAIARNNLFHHCHVGGIVMGGSELSNGGATNCSLLNNTIYGNDTAGAGGGQISLQNYLNGIVIQRNLIATPASFAQLILNTNTTGSYAAGAINWNYYRVNPSVPYEFYWNNVAYSSFATWRSAAGLSKDANSTLSTVSLGLVNNAPTSASPASDFALTSTSVLRNIGDSAVAPFTPAAGEKDYFGQSRVASSRVDIGADEYLSPYQSWLDLYFGLPDGGTGAGTNDDPDADGVKNLLEYSQGMNPTLSDLALAPTTSRVSNKLRLTYHKAAPELTYSIEQNSPLSGIWSTASTVTSPEQTNNAGLYWRDLPLGTTHNFYRFKVAQP